MNIRTLPGSHLWKVDFHIHTPQSKDYKDKSASARDIVDAAIACGLDAIAITDHNDYRFIDNVQQAALGTQLTVFPGVEISTRDGHLIGILDPSKGGGEIQKLLISCGLTNENEYGTEQAICMENFEDVAQRIEQMEGIAIAAHADGKKGFLKTVGVGQARIRITSHASIMALELIDATTKNDWLDGKIYSKSHACIQGSDAHSLDKIGSRPFWIKVARLNIAGLRQAMKDPKTRIRFPNEIQENLTRVFIEKMEVSQGFFGNNTILFNPGLNCIVGGQGVGKSAIIEFIRFALNNISKVGEIQKDHKGKLEKLLTLGGVVTVIFREQDGSRYAISRTYDGAENPVSIAQIQNDETRVEYPLPNYQRRFQILAYSQNEAISVARDAVRQLDLIDSHLDISGEKTNLAAHLRELEESTTKLKQTDKILIDLEDLTKQRISLNTEIKALEEQLKAIEEAQKIPALRDHQQWMDEERFFKSLRDGREEVKSNLLNAIQQIDLEPINVILPSTNLGHEEELQKVIEQNEVIETFLRNLSNQIDQKFKEIREQSQTIAPNWIMGFREHQNEYAVTKQKIENIKATSLQTLLETKKTALSKLNIRINEAQARKGYKANLIKDRERVLNQIESERRRITSKRDKHAKEMTKTLQKRVIISIRPNGNKTEFIEWLTKNTDGRVVKRSVIDAIVEKYSPREFSAILRNKNPAFLAKELNLNENICNSIFLILGQHTDRLYSLEHILLDDFPDIRMKLNNGSFRPLNELSTGQKFTVIILLTLTDDDKPIIYDQPEDALDTALIFSDIAQLLRRSKDNRQFILATHNPNMSVAADLDLAIVVKGSATDAEVEVSGGIEDQTVRTSLIEYLEGGPDAVEHRMRKYEIGII